MRNVFMLLGLLLFSFSAFAGGKITGQVTDEKTSEPIIGALVSVKGTSVGGATDIDGRFTLNVDAGTYVLEIKYIGYQNKNIEDVIVKDGAVVTANVILNEDEAGALEEVVVTATLKKETVNALYLQQKNNVAVSSGISADLIQRSPDRNTGEVLKRVSGASVKDDKFVIIRGLSDRYNAAMVNGAQMPSTEPDKKAFSFDIIPSNLIDNIIINKTATADKPGDFAGGIIQVLTKDIPDEEFFNVGLNLGYNTQATLKETRHNERGTGSYFGYGPNGDNLDATLGTTAQYAALPAAQQRAAASQLQNSYVEKKSTAMPNSLLSISWGDAKHYSNGNKFGIVAGLNLRNSYSFIPDYERGNYTADGEDNTVTKEDQWRFSSSLSGLANFAYVVGKSKITFKNLYNKLYEDRYYDRRGYAWSNNQETILYSTVPSDRQLYNTQLQGEHAIGEKNTKIDWNLNFSNLTAKVNDLRTLAYARSAERDADFQPIPDDTTAFTMLDRNSRRFYSDLKDNAYGANFAITKPFELFGQKQSFKVGYLGLYKTRSFNARIFRYEVADITSFDRRIETLGPDNVLASENISSTGYGLDELTAPTDMYKATGLTNAGYIMFDNILSERVKLNWGVRFETYSQHLDATTRGLETIDTTSNFYDILPSINLSYELNEKSKLRFSGSRTVNRPEFREIAPFTFFDFENNWAINGNPNLVRGRINNFDLKYELFPAAGEIVSIGAYYKYFQDAIEQVMDGQSNLDYQLFGFANAKSAQSIGAEFEIRKNFSFLGEAQWLQNIVGSANFTYTYSTVETDSAAFGLTQNRPLQGQSPYLVNLSILYNEPNTGLAISALYNRIGHRIYTVGNSTIPHTWEKGRDVIDLQVSKKIMKNRGELKLTAANILNAAYVLYWNGGYWKDGDDNSAYNADKDLVFQKYKLGTSFTVGFTYKF